MLSQRQLVPPAATAWAAAARRQRQHPPRPHRPSQRVSALSQGGDEESLDIDALARLLSAEAEKLRQSGAVSLPGTDDDDEEAPQPSGYSSSSDDLLGRLGYSVDEDDALGALGEGGFFSSEFELLQELGQISIRQVAESGDESDDERVALPRAASSSAAAVIAYTASYYSGMPFQDPVVTLVKEYLSGAAAVGANEIRVLSHLAPVPDVAGKWSVAHAPLTPSPPIVRLLGHFLAGASEQAQALAPGTDTDASALWVVLKWEGLAPLALYPSAQQTSGIGLGSLFGGQGAAVRDRFRMLRAIARGSLDALAFCHERGVIHGSLGSGSVLLSTFDDRAAPRQIVKLSDFGFARRVNVPAGGAAGAGDEDTPLALGRRGDQRALAVVLLEAVLGALARGGPSAGTSADTLQRLLGEVFGYSVAEFRMYCLGEPDWEPAVAFLDADDGAGWALLRDLVGGGLSAADLAGSRFCQV